MFNSLPTYKGNATVMMKRSDYDDKMRGMLDHTTTYRKLWKDPLPPRKPG